jgi:hypothetical protein
LPTYKGSAKKFIEKVAFDLSIDTTEPKFNNKGDCTGERRLTVDELKEAISESCDEDTTIIIPFANRLPTSIRYWLEDLMNIGVTVCAIANNNPCKDIFLEMLELELDLPKDKQIREIMKDEAQRLGLSLSDEKLADLQCYVGKNPMLARKAIQNEYLGLNKQNPQHTNYVVIMPIIIAILMGFGIVRFIGLGTGNKSLYIFGGVTLVAGMTLRQLGKVSGARRKL